MTALSPSRDGDLRDDEQSQPVGPSQGGKLLPFREIMALDQAQRPTNPPANGTEGVGRERQRQIIREARRGAPTDLRVSTTPGAHALPRMAGLGAKRLSTQGRPLVPRPRDGSVLPAFFKTIVESPFSCQLQVLTLQEIESPVNQKVGGPVLVTARLQATEGGVPYCLGGF